MVASVKHLAEAIGLKSIKREPGTFFTDRRMQCKQWTFVTCGRNFQLFFSHVNLVGGITSHDRVKDKRPLCPDRHRSCATSRRTADSITIENGRPSIVTRANMISSA